MRGALGRVIGCSGCVGVTCLSGTGETAPFRDSLVASGNRCLVARPQVILRPGSHALPPASQPAADPARRLSPAAPREPSPGHSLAAGTHWLGCFGRGRFRLARCRPTVPDRPPGGMGRREAIPMATDGAGHASSTRAGLKLLSAVAGGDQPSPVATLTGSGSCTGPEVVSRARPLTHLDATVHSVPEASAQDRQALREGLRTRKSVRQHLHLDQLGLIAGRRGGAAAPGACRIASRRRLGIRPTCH
jgi:hypothetical protein